MLRMRRGRSPEETFIPLTQGLRARQPRKVEKPLFGLYRVYDADVFWRVCCRDDEFRIVEHLIEALDHEFRDVRDHLKLFGSGTLLGSGALGD